MTNTGGCEERNWLNANVGFAAGRKGSRRAKVHLRRTIRFEGMCALRPRHRRQDGDPAYAFKPETTA
jgi:hypothetical protein